LSQSARACDLVEVANLYDELVALVAELDASGIEYALCGALALAIHGAPRATKDIDILAKPEDEAQIREAVRRCGFTLEALPMTFRSGISVRRFSKIQGGKPVMLDVLWVNEALRSIWADRLTLPWKAGEIKVVSRDGLITLKLTAGRPQDLVDLQTLEEKERGD
jgi:hypothetical protein